jgi:hypothetical protein
MEAMGTFRRLVCALGLALAVAASATARAQTPTQVSAPAGPRDGWVVLPVDDYRALRAKAIPTPPPPEGPPVEATLTRIDYDLRATGETLSGRALVTVDVVKQGWTRVPLPAGLMVSEARVDGRPIPLVIESTESTPESRPHVLLSRQGRSVLTLDLVVPVTGSGGAETITLPASGSAVSRVALTLPRGGVDLTVNGGFVTERAETQAETRWTVHGSADAPMSLSWKRRADDRRASQALRMRARIAELVTLGEEISTVAATVRLEVVQGLARTISLALPEGLAISQVTGTTVGDWEAAGGSLQVRLLEPSAGDVSLTVHGELRAPREGAIAIPLVRLASAERETGGVVVDVAGAGEIRDRRPRGLDPADPSEFADVVAGRESPSMAAFRFRPLSGGDARALSVDLVRFTPESVLVANVEAARYRAVASEDGRLLVEARYRVRNNQRSFLKFTLPPASTIWSAAVGGRPVKPGVAGADSVLLPLQKGRAGEEAPAFVVELLYFQRVENWAQKGIAHVTLPALDLPVSRTGVTFHHSPRFDVEAEPGLFRTVADLELFADPLKHLSSAEAPPQPAEPAAAFRAGDEADQAGLKALADRYRAEAGGRVAAGSLPVRAAFPALGPSILLASELTPEGQAPAIDFAFKRTR